MNRYVNAISGRLSLRPPQRQSLEVLDRIVEITPPKKGADTAAALEIIKSEFPSGQQNSAAGEAMAGAGLSGDLRHYQASIAQISKVIKIEGKSYEKN